MEENGWLFRALLVIDIAFAMFVLLAIRLTWPRRIKDTVSGNAIRLNGTFSKRREKRELEAGYVWLGTVLSAVLVFMLMANVVLVSIHHYVMPFPIAGAALRQFDVNPVQWKTNLTDRERGDVIQSFEDWQILQGREKRTAQKFSSLLPFNFAWIGLILIAGGLLLFGLGRRYIRSLVQFENGVNQRRQEYLALDMRSRVDSIEGHQHAIADEVAS